MPIVPFPADEKKRNNLLVDIGVFFSCAKGVEGSEFHAVFGLYVGLCISA